MMPSRSLFSTLFLIAIFHDVGVCYGDVDIDVSSDQPSIRLQRAHTSIPLVGMGIGNLPHEQIPQVVMSNLGAGVQMIDTAHASNNEKILATSIEAAGLGMNEKRSGLTRGGGTSGSNEMDSIHVVTKVWYTHLGYERTKVSVKESLTDLKSASSSHQIYVHMLLHWPRCNDDIPWMHCEDEENRLPQWVKHLGPPPHLNKDSAYIESWKALEEIYIDHQEIIKKSKEKYAIQAPMIASIGVSNFDLEDMKQLMSQYPRVPPQIYQGNSWLVFHDPHLMDYLRDHHIVFQAYAVMTGVLQQRDRTPAAYHVLSELSRELTATIHSENKDVLVSEATILLSYFVHSGVGVIPRASTSSHQKENSPQSISAVLRLLTQSHMQRLEKAIPALMKGEDLQVSVSFMNSLSSPIQVHWVNPETNEEVLVSNTIHPGSVEMQTTHPGHKFVAYDPERSIRKEFLVDVGYGEEQHFHVEPEL